MKLHDPHPFGVVQIHTIIGHNRHRGGSASETRPVYGCVRLERWRPYSCVHRGPAALHSYVRFVVDVACEDNHRTGLQGLHRATTGTESKPKFRAAPGTLRTQWRPNIASIISAQYQISRRKRRKGGGQNCCPPPPPNTGHNPTDNVR